MAQSPLIIVKPSFNDPVKKAEAKYRTMIEAGFVPLRIKCPECPRIFTLFVKDFDQGISVILGQACPYCKRFIKETDDPEKLLVDLEDFKKEQKNG